MAETRTDKYAEYRPVWPLPERYTPEQAYATTWEADDAALIISCTDQNYKLAPDLLVKFSSDNICFQEGKLIDLIDDALYGLGGESSNIVNEEGEKLKMYIALDRWRYLLLRLRAAYGEWQAAEGSMSDEEIVRKARS